MASPSLAHLTIMAYRTDTATIIAAAEPLLSWAAINNVGATVALEAGPLAREREKFSLRVPSASYIWLRWMQIKKQL